MIFLLVFNISTKHSNIPTDIKQKKNKSNLFDRFCQAFLDIPNLFRIARDSSSLCCFSRLQLLVSEIYSCFYWTFAYGLISPQLNKVFCGRNSEYPGTWFVSRCFERNCDTVGNRQHDPKRGEKNFPLASLCPPLLKRPYTGFCFAGASCAVFLKQRGTFKESIFCHSHLFLDLEDLI